MTKEEAIEVLKDMLDYQWGFADDEKPKSIEALKLAIEALENQKTGHWIELGCVGNDNYDFKCSECNHSDIHSKAVKVNYCWYCGAKLEGENNE